eukprot:24363_1
MYGRQFQVSSYRIFWTHPLNPNRYFHSMCLGTGEVGHTWYRVDGISAQTRGCYQQREAFATCSDRAEYINNESNIQVIEMKEFHETPKLFKKLFRPSSQWVDQNGKPAMIRDDPGIDYDFGQSLVFNEKTKSYEWVDHYDEVWIRHHYDFKKKHRKINIMKTNAHKISTDEFMDLNRERIDPPTLTEKKLLDTLDICDLFENSSELREYYKVGHERIITDTMKRKIQKPKDNGHVAIKMK